MPNNCRPCRAKGLVSQQKSNSGFDMKSIVIFCFIAFFSTSAFAHSKLTKMMPDDGSVVENIPQSIEFSFGQSIRLTKVEVIHDNMAHPLDLGAHKSFAKEFSIPFIGKENGRYQINWRGLGEDGHAMTGSFSFEVR